MMMEMMMEMVEGKIKNKARTMISIRLSAGLLDRLGKAASWRTKKTGKNTSRADLIIETLEAKYGADRKSTS